MTPRKPSVDTVHNQRLASDPSLSAWVSAGVSAGPVRAGRRPAPAGVGEAARLAYWPHFATGKG